MHPLNTLIQSQRRQVHQSHGRPSRYREEERLAARAYDDSDERRSLAVVTATMLVTCLLVVTLATVLI